MGKDEHVHQCGRGVCQPLIHHQQDTSHLPLYCMSQYGHLFQAMEECARLLDPFLHSKNPYEGAVIAQGIILQVAGHPGVCDVELANICQQCSWIEETNAG